MEIYISKNFIRILIQSYFKIYKKEITNLEIQNKLFDILTKDKIIEVNNSIDWKTDNESYQGIYIKDINHFVYFSQMLNIHGKANSRNTYIKQNASPIRMLAKEKGSTLSISINPFDIEGVPPSANSIKINMKELTTLGFKINPSLSKQEIQPYNNFNEYLRERDESKKKNSKNFSTFIKYFNQEEKIVVFGRLEGASGKDTLSVIEVISIILKSKKIIFQFCDISKVYNNSLLKKIEKFNWKILDNNYFEKEKEKNLKTFFETESLNTNDFNEILKRNQVFFLRNIINKYINIKNHFINKCFICDYEISSNLISAHIYRVADIKKDYETGKINYERAASLLMSGDNGFLLCPNQDKEFEKGMIVFDLNSKKFIINKNKIPSKNNEIYIQNNINNKEWDKKVITDDFIHNINEHHKRIEFKLNS